MCFGGIWDSLVLLICGIRDELGINLGGFSKRRGINERLWALYLDLDLDRRWETGFLVVFMNASAGNGE